MSSRIVLKIQWLVFGLATMQIQHGRLYCKHYVEVKVPNSEIYRKY